MYTGTNSTTASRASRPGVEFARRILRMSSAFMLPSKILVKDRLRDCNGIIHKMAEFG